jgi:hypothetical protein
LQELPDPTTGAIEQVMAPKPPPQIQQEMAIIVANGGRYFGWDSPTPESGLIAERFEYMGEVVEPFLRARQTWCLGSRRVPDVSLLHNAAAHYATTESQTTSFTKRNNRIEGAAAALARLHLNYEMLPDWRLAKQDVRSQLVIAEHPKRLTRQTCANLVEFVAQGGSLLMTGMGITLDERFEKLFGAVVQEGPRQAEPLAARVDDHRHAFEHWLFRLKCSTAQTVIQVEDAQGNPWPLLTCHKYGAGTASYVALPLLSLHGDCVVPWSLTKKVFKKVVPESQRVLASDAPETVEVVLRVKNDMRIVHLVNMAQGTRSVIRRGTRSYVTIHELPRVGASQIEVSLPRKPVRIVLQPQAIPLESWTWNEDRLTMRVPGFPIHQMVVVEVE